jgi:hypothetical protein
MEITRRAFLGMGAGAGLASLAHSWPGRRKVKGVLWLWMHGGMSQFHTWDPKPGRKGMPPLKPIASSVPGIEVTELLPVCATQMHHLTVVRTLSHGEVHEDAATLLLHTGVRPPIFGEASPSIGTILSYELGAKDFPLPSHIALDPPALPDSSPFGEEHLPWVLAGVASPIPNLRRSVDADRDRERGALLAAQNGDWAATRKQRPVEQQLAWAAKAEQVMNTTLLKAFDVGAEPEALRKEYGAGFGERCLLGRRLLEAGCPFVEIGLRGWTPVQKETVWALDRGLGTLVKDLAARGLLGDVLVVCAAPFGHSPPSQPQGKNVGWPRGFSVVLAGGMLPGGVAHGETGPDGTGSVPPVSVEEFLATILSACGIDWEREYRWVDLRRRKYVKSGQPVQELF